MADTLPLYHTLCQLLSGPADPALTSTLSSDDWHALADTARREGVGPLLYHALKEQRSQGARELRSEGAGEISPQHLCTPAPPHLCPPAPLPRVPPAVQSDLRQAYYATAARNLLVYRELARVLAALATADHRRPTTDDPNPKSEIRNPKSEVPIVLLKGAALATTLYPSIGLRPMGDLDLLVPEDRLVEAVARLKALGYVEPHPDMAPGLNALAGHHVHLQGGQDVHLAVELHWTLIGGEHDWRSPSLPWFWEQTEEWKREPRSTQYPVRNSPFATHNSPPAIQPSSHPAISHQPSAILTLTPTAHLLYLCAHLMLQHGEAHSVLRWFYDIYLLVEREGQRIQWDELVARAREFRWAPAVHAALVGARDRFSPPSAGAEDNWLPPGVLEALAEASDRQASRLVARRADRLQTRATGLLAAASVLSPRARLRLLLAVVVPGPAYMRWRYNPRPPWLWPLCYPYRWFDILREGLSTLWATFR